MGEAQITPSLISHRPSLALVGSSRLPPRIWNESSAGLGIMNHARGPLEAGGAFFCPLMGGY